MVKIPTGTSSHQSGLSSTTHGLGVHWLLSVSLRRPGQTRIQSPQTADSVGRYAVLLQHAMRHGRSPSPTGSMGSVLKLGQNWRVRTSKWKQAKGTGTKNMLTGINPPNISRNVLRGKLLKVHGSFNLNNRVPQPVWYIWPTTEIQRQHLNHRNLSGLPP